MQVLCHVIRPPVGSVVIVLCAALFVASAPSTAQAAGVVGTGTAESCTDAALNTALAGGGLVTFDCGADPATIDISTGTGTKTIATDTTIDGGGLITISGGDSVRVFSVDAEINFTVQNLTIANGRIRRAVGGGGGIGGGIRNNGSLTVTNSTVSHCVAEAGFSASGAGGIYNVGTLTVTNSTFSENSARAGGGILNEADGTLTVTNSTFSGNSASFGGGILNEVDGTLTVTNSTFSGNSASGNSGGGITNNGTLTVTNSTFSGNSASFGGGIFNGGGTLTVTNSTFSGNSASFGGGIVNERVGTLTVTNSTFSENSASFGGGVFNDFGALTVANCTFSGDSASDAAGGVFNNGGTLTVTNTIVANSTSGDNCSGTITDGGHNLDDGASCGFSEANGSLSNMDPQLDPAGLQDNGGPTETVALCTAVGVPAGCTADSPAIETGDQAICAAAPVDNLDQRGFVRPGTGHTNCSIGAYEADAVGPTCTGDCDGNGVVAINELILGVNIALGVQPATACPAFANSDGMLDIAHLIKGVNNALNAGCGIG